MKVAKTTTSFLDLSWVWCRSWNNDLSCHISSKKSGFYLFFWAVIWQVSSNACCVGSSSDIILTISLLPFILIHLLLFVFSGFFWRLHTFGKIFTDLELLGLRFFVPRVLVGGALEMFHGKIKWCHLWTMLNHILNSRKGLKFYLCFALNGLFDSFLPIVKLQAFLFPLNLD